jgi:hypothetical protein
MCDAGLRGEGLVKPAADAITRLMDTAAGMPDAARHALGVPFGWKLPAGSLADVSASGNDATATSKFSGGWAINPPRTPIDAAATGINPGRRGNNPIQSGIRPARDGVATPSKRQ